MKEGRTFTMPPEGSSTLRGGTQRTHASGRTQMSDVRSVDGVAQGFSNDTMGENSVESR